MPGAAIDVCACCRVQLGVAGVAAPAAGDALTRAEGLAAAAAIEGTVEAGAPDVIEASIAAVRPISAPPIRQLSAPRPSRRIVWESQS